MEVWNHPHEDSDIPFDYIPVQVHPVDYEHTVINYNTVDYLNTIWSFMCTPSVLLRFSVQYIIYKLVYMLTVLIATVNY